MTRCCLTGSLIGDENVLKSVWIYKYGLENRDNLSSWYRPPCYLFVFFPWMFFTDRLTDCRHRDMWDAINWRVVLYQHSRRTPHFGTWLDIDHDCCCKHDDDIKWNHFSYYWPSMTGIHRSPVNSPHNGQCREALMFSLTFAWTNGWVNNRDAGDLRRHCVHYGVTVIFVEILISDLGLASLCATWCILIQISLKSVPNVQTNNKSTLVKTIGWRRTLLFFQ